MKNKMCKIENYENEIQSTVDINSKGSINFR